jgi:hypothetical protein
MTAVRSSGYDLRMTPSRPPLCTATSSSGRLRHERIVTLGAVAILVLAGCGYRRPGLVTVTGTVTLDGEPVEAASVSFAPVAGGRQANGGTNDKGIFFLSSYSSRDGAILGKHRVSVTKIVPTPAAEMKLRQRQEQTKSAEGQEETAPPPIDLQASDYRNLLPARYADPASSGLEVEVSRWMKPVALELRSDAGQTK